jgi:hypothetical protein
MSADTTRFAASEARKAQGIRRAKVAPLLAVGMSVRVISAETGIPVGAVHRAKRRLEKDLAQRRQNAKRCHHRSAIANELCGEAGHRRCPQDVRRLTVAVYERFVESAIGRGLLGRADRDNPWAVVSALFAGMFDDHTIEWLNKRGYLRWDERCRGEAIIAAVNRLIARHL